MPIQFPTSPTNGQVYSGYYYDAALSAWKASPISAGPIAISDTPPAGAIHGDMWYKSNDGTTYIYYNDGSTSQWVEVRSEIATSKVGLIPIIPSSISVTAGTASAAIDGTVSFTSCTGITLVGIFTETYRNYLIVCEAESTGSAADIYGQLVTSGGSALSSGYVGGRIAVSNSGSVASNWQGASGVIILSRTNGSNGFAFEANVFNPFQSKQKKITTNFAEISTIGVQAYINPSTSSYASLNFYANGTTMNTGTVKVYGYN